MRIDSSSGRSTVATHLDDADPTPWLFTVDN
jgi:hypothetical protein